MKSRIIAGITKKQHKEVEPRSSQQTFAEEMEKFINCTEDGYFRAHLKFIFNAYQEKYKRSDMADDPERGYSPPAEAPDEEISLDDIFVDDIAPPLGLPICAPCRHMMAFHSDNPPHLEVHCEIRGFVHDRRCSSFTR